MRATYYDSNDVGGGAVTTITSASIASETGSISLDKSSLSNTMGWSY